MSFLQSCLKDLHAALGYEVSIYIYNSCTQDKDGLGSGNQQIINHEDDLLYVKSMITEPTTFRLYVKGSSKKYSYQALSSFCLQQLPGCCGICLSFNSFVIKAVRGKGVATRLNQLRYDFAKHLGYGSLMCTDVETNLPQKKLLKKNGWKDVHTFDNPRTGNQVAISVKDIAINKPMIDAQCKVCTRTNTVGAPKCWWCQVQQPC